MLEHLRNPEYLHTLLNPLPIYGLAMGVLALVIALIANSRAARVAALTIVFVSTFAALPVYHYGEAAYDRILTSTDADGSKWLEEHQRRGERLVWCFYVVAAIAAAALLSERFAPRTAIALTIVTLIAAGPTLGAGAYIAQAGGRIRHREFRYAPPPGTPQDDTAE